MEQKVALLRRRFVRHQTEMFAHQWFSRDQDRGGYVPVRVGTCQETPQCLKPEFCRHRPTRPMRDQDLKDHLRGQETIGIYQLSSEDRVLWIVLDIDVNNELVRQAGITRDEADENAKAHTLNLAKVMKGWGIPFLCESSGSKGYHLWVFMRDPVPASKAQAVGRWLESQVSPPRGIAVEVFPKQAGRHGFGSLVKLPMGVHQKTNRRCRFVDAAFKPLVDQWAALRDVLVIGEEDLDELIEEHQLHIVESIRMDGPSLDFEPRATLPCFISLMRVGVSKGMRDVAAFKLGCYLRTRGLTPEMAEGAMFVWNEINKPPMDTALLLEKLESSYRGNYSPFPCTDPMFDHLCDPTCRFYENKMQRRAR